MSTARDLRTTQGFGPEPGLVVPAVVPHHLGIILDGNRRWAAARGLPPIAGHREGARRLLDIIDWADMAGISTLTTWVLSVDNLRRPREELEGLLPLIGQTVDHLAAQQRWPLRHVGDSSILTPELRGSLNAAEKATRGLTAMTVNMAVGYSGRREIAAAICGVLTERFAGSPDFAAAEADWEELITNHLCAGAQRDPDLIIRTSGEKRLSGFLMWQSTWTELCFSDVLWPDFTYDDFRHCLQAFAARTRRYGT
ncbi:polyprenyl diphosphate synthase [Nocardia brasiliensis]|uniref:polyprenyl diphosphate synthase n=1 Tax=Nocardia brasiliensis TaxID=37326 RepID=UPI0024589D75|nr:polyprenyl diphosphate synthase [Nocardia brasiliensis]